MTRERELERRVRKLEAENAYLKIDSPEDGEVLSNREKSAAVSALSGRHPFSDLLEAARLPRSSYYYALAHPKAPTRPELWEAVAEIFSRTSNGCGHRQIAMCLRAEQGAVIADKTVLKTMREMGMSCGIRRETDRHRRGSYKGKVGETFENVIGRDFKADRPWLKLGTDVTEFRQSWGKAYFAPACDFGSKEIVVWSTSRSPDLCQQKALIDQLLDQDSGGLEARAALGHGMAVPACDVVRLAERGGGCAEHVRQLHRQRRHGAGLRPYQGRVLPREGAALLRGLQEGPR